MRGYLAAALALSGDKGLSAGADVLAGIHPAIIPNRPIGPPRERARYVRLKTGRTYQPNGAKERARRVQQIARGIRAWRLA